MQRAAYVMRISGWSSDVCSSDLLGGNVHDASLYRFGGGGRDIVGKPGENPVLGRGPIVDARMGVARGGDLVRDRRLADQVQAPHQTGRPPCRDRVCK